MKNQKGITLIALIITVIVMVIIAAAAIGLVWNQGSMLEQIQDSVDRYEKAAQNTEKMVTNAVEYMDKYYKANP